MNKRKRHILTIKSQWRNLRSCRFDTWQQTEKKEKFYSSPAGAFYQTLSPVCQPLIGGDYNRVRENLRAINKHSKAWGRNGAGALNMLHQKPYEYCLVQVVCSPNFSFI